MTETQRIHENMLPAETGNSGAFGQHAVVAMKESGAVAAMSRERYEIEGAMILARRFPRDEQQCREKILAVSGRPTFARDALYSFPRGREVVEGPSVRMARELGRIWGNIRSGFRVIALDAKEQEAHIQGFAFDVETNAYRTEEATIRTRTFRRDKGWINLLSDDRLAGDTERQLAELLGRTGSKLERNCLLRLLPSDLVDEAREAVKIAQAADVDPGVLKAVVQFFGEKGVDLIRLERKLGKQIRDAKPEDIATLRRWAKTIKDGEATISEFFPIEDPDDKPAKGVKGTLARLKKQDAPSEPDPETVDEPVPGDPEVVDATVSNDSYQKLIAAMKERGLRWSDVGFTLCEVAKTVSTEEAVERIQQDPEVAGDALDALREDWARQDEQNADVEVES